MNYGLYLSATGALSSMHRQDVLAHNLANVNTIGFKPDQIDVRQRLPERLEDLTADVSPRLMLERLGGGLFLEPTRVSMKQGDLIETGADLDLAIEGDGLFVVAPGGRTAPDQIRLSRDGRLSLNGRGQLVMVSNGHPLLDVNNRPVELDRSTPIRIDERGAIHQDGTEVAQLRIVAAPGGVGLLKEGHNLLRFTDPDAAARGPFTGRVRQGYTEASAADPIMTLNAMISAAKAAQSNLKMMQYHDNILGLTVNTLGRVA